MGKSKKIIIGTVAGVTAAAVCVSGVLVWRHYSRGSDVDGVAYVMPIKDVNSAATTISDLHFSAMERESTASRKSRSAGRMLR